MTRRKRAGGFRPPNSELIPRAQTQPAARKKNRAIDQDERGNFIRFSIMNITEVDENSNSHPGDESKFERLFQIGFEPLPVMPHDAKIAPNSSVKESDRGKVPGVYHRGHNTWSGYGSWTKVKIVPRKLKTWNSWPGVGACIRTGAVVAIDIDVTDEDLAKAVEQKAIDMLGSAPCRIGNPPKRLLPYRTATPRRKQKVAFTHPETGETHAVEFLGTGQQFVAYGIHPKTKKPYWWEGDDLIECGFDGLTQVTPQQLDEFFEEIDGLMAEAGYRVSAVAKAMREAAKPRTPIGDLNMTGDPELVRQALNLIGNDFDYDEWIRFVAAIKAALGGKTEHYHIYEDWCLLYAGNDGAIAQEKWNSIADTELGFEYLIQVASKVAHEISDLDFIRACTEYQTRLSSELAKAILGPDSLATIPTPIARSTEADMEAILAPLGLVGKIAAYHDANSHRKTPILGVAAGLAAVSALAANNYAFVPDVGQPAATNLYLILVAATGLGKEHPRTVIKEVLRTADVADMDVDAASDAALLRHLSEHPNSIWLKDEIGRHLEFAGNPNGGHQYALITALMSLYGLPFSSAGSKTYSDRRKNIPPVQNPYMTILSTSTRESLERALNSSVVVDGTLNRFVVIHDPNKQPNYQDIPSTRMDDELKKAIKNLSHIGGVANLANQVFESDSAPTELVEIGGRHFIKVIPAEGVMSLLLNFRTEADDKRAQGGIDAPLWARAYENMLRVAAVIAIGDSDPRQPVMTTGHAEWAATFSRWAIANSISLMDTVSDNEVERASKAIENFVHEVIENPAAAPFTDHNREGYVSKTQIVRRFRMFRGGEIDQHLNTLCEAGILEQIQVDTGGRAAKGFRPMERIRK